MDLKQLRASPSVKARPDRKRVGRGPGSGMGKTSTRGMKGAGARSGWKLRDFYEGGQMPVQRRIPKRGFSNENFERTFAIVNVGDLESFAEGTEVTPRLLEESGLVKQGRRLGTDIAIKVLGDGELTKKLVVKAHKFSKQAIEKIAKAGGEAATLMEQRPKPAKRKAAAKPAPAAAAPGGAGTEKPEKPAKKKPQAEE